MFRIHKVNSVYELVHSLFGGSLTNFFFLENRFREKNLRIVFDDILILILTTNLFYTTTVETTVTQLLTPVTYPTLLTFYRLESIFDTLSLSTNIFLRTLCLLYKYNGQYIHFSCDA